MLINKNVLWLLLDKVLLLLLTFIGSVATYRTIGPENAGLLNVALGFWGLFGFLLSMGLDTIAVKYIIKSKNRFLNKSINSIVIIRLIGGIVAVVISNSLIGFYTDNETVKKLLFIFSILGFCSPFLVLDALVQAFEDFDYGVRIRAISKVLSLIFLAVIIYFNFNIYYFAIYQVVFNVLLSVQYFIYLKRKSSDFKLFNPLSFKLTKFYFKSALPFVFSAIMVPIFMQSDILMINYFLGEQDAGYYSASSKLIVPITQVMSIFAVAYFPQIMKSKNATKLVGQLSFIIIGISVLISVSVLLGANYIITILYGDGYLPASLILQIQIISLPIIVIGPLSTRWLILNNLVYFELYKTTIAAVCNIILNCFCIKKFGVVGAAYASLISYFIANILCLVFSKKTRPLIYSIFTFGMISK